MTNVASIQNLYDQVQSILVTTGAVLWSVVNNAGTLVLAELEWQTPNMIQSQIQVMHNFDNGSCVICFFVNSLIQIR